METIDSVFEKMTEEHKEILERILENEKSKDEDRFKKSENESNKLKEQYENHKKQYSNEEWDNFNRILSEGLPPLLSKEDKTEQRNNKLEKINKFRRDYLVCYIKLIGLDLNDPDDVKELEEEFDCVHMPDSVDDAAYELATMIFDAVEYVKDDYKQNWASLNKEPFVIKLKECFPQKIWEEAIQYYKDGNHDT